MDTTLTLQGETEALDNCDSSYQAHLQSMFSQIRTGTGASTKIIVSGLNGWSNSGHWPVIRTAQSAACTADGSAVYVDMSDLGTTDGTVHYTASENITVGTRLANALITALGGDTTPPTVSITTSSPQAISSDSLTVTGTASDDTAVSGCKYRIGSEPDATHGTACTGTTSWSCATSGYSSGANTLYVECYDAVPNYSTGHSITVNYTPTLSPQYGISLKGAGIFE
jgi:hypothetical protein